MTYIKRMIYLLIGLVVGVGLVVLLVNIWVIQSTADQLYDDLNDLPSHDVALVLGTSPWIAKGIPNLYFESRMNAAAKLLKRGKVKHLLLSGDNGNKEYNEPEEMRAALNKRGVPDSLLTLDYAGFRTLDSVVRCREIFQQQKILILSQPFHNHRAIFIANYYGYPAVAYNAEKVNTGSRKAINREYLARVKAILDLYIFKTSPKFLGAKEVIDLHDQN